jgi:hypothetical protein
MDDRTGRIPSRLLPAFGLGAGAFVLLFVLGEGVTGIIPDTMPGADYLKGGILFGGMAGYLVLAQFLLSNGHPQAVRTDWPLVLALNLFSILIPVMVFLGEHSLTKALFWLGVAAASVACSYAGAVLAGQVARRKVQVLSKEIHQ